MTPDAGLPGASSSSLAEVETPIGVVDLARAQANAQRVVEYCASNGFGWRPHIKTHKSPRMARLQLEAGAIGLTVATLHEAEVMAGVTNDLLLAYPPVGASKLDRLSELASRPGLDLKVALDSKEALQGVAEAAVQAGTTIGILVEIDAGLRRVGISDPEAVADLATRAAETEGVAFRGVLFYAGHIRTMGPEADAPLRELGVLLEQVYEALAVRGLTAEIVSGGTTPTLWRSHELPGLTEIRPGTCIYNDRDALACGSAQLDQLAYSVLATVVSTAVPGRAAVDAGSKALAKEDRGGSGYGLILGHPEAQVVALSEEHGMIDLTGSSWRPSVGDRVRIVPNHVCVSVNLQDAVMIVHPDETVERWPLEGRGREPARPFTEP